MIKSAPIIIQCEGQGCTAEFTAELRLFVPGQVLRRDIEAVRALAKQHGWRYRRPTVHEANRDLCPECVAKLERARSERRAVHAC